MAYMLIFLLKKLCVAFAFTKAIHIFSAKIPVNSVLYLLEQLYNNILTINKLVKLTMLFIGTSI